MVAKYGFSRGKLCHLNKTMHSYPTSNGDHKHSVGGRQGGGVLGSRGRVELGLLGEVRLQHCPPLDLDLADPEMGLNWTEPHALQLPLLLGLLLLGLHGRRWQLPRVVLAPIEA